MISFARRRVIGCLLLATSMVSASSQGLVKKEELEKFLTVSTKVAMVQDVLMAAGEGSVHCHSGRNKADAKEVTGWLRMATDITQIPNEVARMALEADRQPLQDVVHALAKGVPHFNGDSKHLPVETLRLGLWPLLYSICFNKVNQSVHALFPNADQEWQRRVARTVAVLGLRTAAFGANKCVDEHLNVRDAWGEHEAAVIEHICYEIAGAIVSSAIIAEETSVGASLEAVAEVVF